MKLKTVEFAFDNQGKEFLRETMGQFVEEVNNAIREGKVPPKSKTPELIPRLASALHIFNSVMGELLAGVSATQPPTTVSRAYLQRNNFITE